MHTVRCRHVLDSYKCNNCKHVQQLPCRIVSLYAGAMGQGGVLRLCGRQVCERDWKLLLLELPVGFVFRQRQCREIKLYLQSRVYRSRWWTMPSV